MEDQNAKNKEFDVPVKLPHVDPRDYTKGDYDTKDGTEGFSPQYSGNAISGKANTSAFDITAGTPTALPRGSDTSKESVVELEQKP